MTDTRVELVVLVPCKNTFRAVKGLLSRPSALGMRDIAYTIRPHPRHDAGVRKSAAAFLRPLCSPPMRAIVLLDLEGSGKEKIGRDGLEVQIETSLRQNGWDDRARCVAIKPELEAWVWSSSPHVARCLGWKGSIDSMRHWLESQHLWPAGFSKPTRPKEAMEACLRRAGIPRSAAVYEDLARKVALGSCRDASFLKMKRTLQEWFPRM